MTMSSTVRRMALVLLVLLLAAWRVPAAQAQVGLSLSGPLIMVDSLPLPLADSGLPGTDLTVSGTLTNMTGSVLSLMNVSFTPGYGPAGADLNSAILASDYLLPASLGPNQVYTGPLLTLSADPGAPTGDYTDSIAVDYGTGAVGRDFVVALLAPGQPPPGGAAVPETGGAALVALGLGLLGLGARRRAARV